MLDVYQYIIQTEHNPWLAVLQFSAADLELTLNSVPAPVDSAAESLDMAGRKIVDTSPRLSRSLRHRDLQESPDSDDGFKITRRITVVTTPTLHQAGRQREMEVWGGRSSRSAIDFRSLRKMDRDSIFVKSDGKISSPEVSPLSSPEGATLLGLEERLADETSSPPPPFTKYCDTGDESDLSSEVGTADTLLRTMGDSNWSIDSAGAVIMPEKHRREHGGSVIKDTITNEQQASKLLQKVSNSKVAGCKQNFLLKFGGKAKKKSTGTGST
jgi:hypothetical protein